MDYKYIHLLYVPTMACNMCCKYCYLEDNTVADKTDKKVLDTLDFAVNYCIAMFLGVVLWLSLRSG